MQVNLAWNCPNPEQQISNWKQVEHEIKGKGIEEGERVETERKLNWIELNWILPQKKDFQKGSDEHVRRFDFEGLDFVLLSGGGWEKGLWTFPPLHCLCRSWALHDMARRHGSILVGSSLPPFAPFPAQLIFFPFYGGKKKAIQRRKILN